MTSEDLGGRPHKVWSCDRQTRKCVVVSTLEDLRLKGAAKLGYSNSSELKIVLEIDGTEVEDENYFQLAERDTVFQMLQPNEKWLPPGVEALRAGDETDYESHKLPAMVSCSDPVVLLKYLEKDIANLLLFSSKQVEIVSRIPIDSLDPQQFNLAFAEAVIEACEKLVLEKQNAEDAINFYKNLTKESDEIDSSAKELRNAEQASKTTDSLVVSADENASTAFEAIENIRKWQGVNNEDSGKEPAPKRPKPSP
uniref:Putative cell death activator cide-b protein n=1 Tax=Ornithodoros turicata TaxID=34597 RepID=A0A2R5L7R3_9ACAR